MITEAIQELLLTWAEDLYLGTGSRVLYFSKLGNWHVRERICEGYSRIIYDGSNFEDAFVCLHDKSRYLFEVPAGGSVVPSA